MIPSRLPVAVLLFTRSAGEDGARKQFVRHGSRAGNAAVAAQLIAQATATARQAGVDFRCVDSGQQTGATFGQRLSGALKNAFAQGYEQLLIIGNDCLQLDAGLLRHAVASLATTGAVLGPATDGGVYLLGMSRAHFEAVEMDVWAALPWQTAALGHALARQLRAAGAGVHLLPCLADVDNERDMARALRLRLARPLRRTLRRLRAISTHPAMRADSGVGSLVFVVAQPRRGPPNC